MKLSCSAIGKKLSTLFPYWLLIFLIYSQAFAANDASTFNFAVFGAKGVTMSGGSYADGYTGNPSGHVKGQNKNGDVGTNSLQPCGIQLNGGAQIFGKARVGSGGNPATGICLNGGASVYNNDLGTLAIMKAMTPVTDPGGGTAMGDLKLSGHSAKTLTAGSYRFSSLTLSGGSTLTLDGAATLFIDGNLSVSGGASIVVLSGPVTIYMNGQKLDLTGGALINLSATPENLTIYGTTGLQSAKLSGASTQHLQVYAPGADLFITGNQETFGSLIGNSVTLSGGAAVHFAGGSDSTPPVVTVGYPPDGAVFDTPLIKVTGSVNEAVSSVTVNGIPAAINGTDFSLAGVQLAGGSNGINVQATDLAGNVGSATVTITLNTIPLIPPVLAQVTSPTNVATVTLTGTAPAGATVKLFAGATQLSTVTADQQGAFSFPGVTLSEGANTFTATATATDASGTESSPSSPLSCVLDTQAPTLAISTLADGSYTNNITLNISGTAKDNVGLRGLQVNGTSVPVNADGSFSYPLVLHSGANAVNITATDLAGNQASDNRTVNLDLTAPVVTINSPADNSKTATAQLTVTGSVDKTSTVRIALGGILQQTVLTGSAFSADLALVSGSNTVEISAIDLAGNTSTAKRTVLYDDKVPSLSITDPSQDLRTNAGTLTIRGTAFDPLTQVTVSVSVDGQTFAAPVVNGAFEQSISFSDEKNYAVVVTATNEVGSSSSMQRNIIYDITPPELHINAVVTPTNQATQTVTGTMEAGATIAVGCPTATVGSVSYPTATTWSATLSAFTAYGNDITVTATDAAGNSASASVQIVYDVTGPTGTISIDGGGASTGSTQAQLQLSSSDSSGVTQMRFSSDGVNWTDPTTYGSTASWQLPTGDGTKLVYVQYMDQAGNWSNPIQGSVVLDTTPPVVTASPAGGLFRTPQTVTLSANEQATIYYTTDGSTPTLSSAVYSQPLSVPVSATLSFFAKDAAGNLSQPVRASYTIDTIPPTVTISAPAAGLLTRIPAVTVTGTLSEPGTVSVNGTPAVVTGTSFTVSYTLSEGPNTLNVQAYDLAGNPGSASVSVTLDTTPPAAPVISALKTPTNLATVTVTGSAEPASAVKVWNGGALLTTVAADASGKFSVPGVTLAEGANSFTATAADAAGNVSAVSAPVSVVLDTKPPVITVTAPADKSFTNNPQLAVKGSLDDASATLTLNGSQVALNGSDFQQGITLTPGLNSITLTATDPAGNSATTTLTVTLDTVPPTVAISAPVSGLVTNNPQVTLSGTLSKQDTTASVNNAQITVTNQAFSSLYTLTEGDNTLTVTALDKAGNSGSASVNVVLDTQAPQLSISAPGEAAAGANITIGLNGSDNRGLTLVEVKADGVPIWSGGNAPSVSQSVSYKLSPALNAGSQVQIQARGLDAAGNEGTASAVIKISQAATGPGYLQGKVLDDSRGLLMSGATVTVTDAKGSATPLTTVDDGGYFIQAAAGSALVQVAKPGYTMVERVVPVLPDSNATALDARLTPVNGDQHPMDGSGGAVKVLLSSSSTLAVELTVPSGALASPGDLRVTPLGNQGLAGILPAGWSPLAVADIRLLDPASGSAVDTTFGVAANIKFPLPASTGLTADSVLTLASYNAASHQWIAQGNAALASDLSSAGASIPATGEYALLLADPAPNAPPAASAGSPLQAATSAALNFDATSVTGQVVPQAAPPSAGLKAAGEVVLSAADGANPAPQLISGQVVESRITESFNLNSGDEIDSPVYTQDLVLYRAPCVTSIGAGALSSVSGPALRTTFPVSPSKDFTIVDLLLGKVGIEILEPESTSSGVMVGADGARLVDADGNVLAVPAGALSQTTPVSTKTGSAALGVVGNDLVLLKVVDVNLTRQTLGSPATLAIPAPVGVNPALPLLVARGVDVKGVTKLKLVALARQSGSFVSSDGSAAGVTLPGVNVSGTYYFLQAKSAIGFIAGTVSDSSNAPFTGALVKSDSGSLIDLSASNGGYLLAAPVASFNVSATDLYKGDVGTAAGTIGAANQVTAVNLTIKMVLPQVVSIVPAANAVNVQPSDPVVVTFSKGMDKSSITSATLKVADSTGAAVSGVISFSVDGTAATFYPAASLQSQASYSVTVSGAIKDLQGYTLGQDLSSSFTVRKTSAPPLPAAGMVTGTFPDADGFITVTGTQGSAEPNDTVLLVNDNSGEIVSLTPGSDGSFSGKIRGQLGDQIKVVLMDNSGNQTVISYLTFKSDDGRYLVTAKGGSVQGDSGSQLDLPDGALVGPTVIKLTTKTQDNLSQPVPAHGNFLGAVNLDTGGINFQKPVEISIPVPANMPDGAVPFLAQPQSISYVDGTVEKVYAIIDSAKVVNGRLTTACPPFDGVLGLGEFVFLYVDGVMGDDVIISGVAYQDMDGQPGYLPGTDKPIRGAVIRAPGAENFVSFTNSSGHYATYGFTSPGACRNFPLTAVHPLTMNKVSVNITTCDAPYIVNNFNFKLADKNTVFPDTTPPVINMDVQLAPGQDPSVKLVNGAVTAGADLLVPISFDEQLMGTATLSVNFRSSDNSSLTTTAVQVDLKSPTPGSGSNPAIQNYLANLTFPTSLQGSQSGYFRPGQVGLYTLTVEAVDATGNRSKKSMTVRSISQGYVPASFDGPPVVISLSPGANETGVKVDTNVAAIFSEFVKNANETTFQLLDTETGLPVPATVATSMDNGIMKATLTPKQSLAFGHTYEVYIPSSPGAIIDIAPNPSAQGQLLPLSQEVRSRFTTVSPSAFDLASGQFTDGRDIALYTDVNRQRLYSCVTAGSSGWRVIDVTDSKNPAVVFPPSSGHQFADFTDYRGVAVEPQMKLMGITENISFPDGNQYGYVRFYDLTDPTSPNLGNPVGKEMLAQAYSGIPGRLAMQGSYTFIATVNAGLQVVDVKTALKYVTDGATADGSSIVGGYDSVGEGYGQPNDIVLYGGNKGLLTTNSGYILNLDLSTPEIPNLIAPFPAGDPHPLSAAEHVYRVGAVTDYTYIDGSGNPQTMDLALFGTMEGKLKTMDLSDMTRSYTVKDSQGNDASAIVSDVAINKFGGLAYVSTFSSILVVDIKDPKNPRLVTTITQLPDTSAAVGTTPSMIPIGSTPAIVEQNGWLYLASQPKGMRAIDLGTPDGLTYLCNDCYNFR